MALIDDSTSRLVADERTDDLTFAPRPPYLAPEPSLGREPHAALEPELVIDRHDDLSVVIWDRPEPPWPTTTATTAPQAPAGPARLPLRAAGFVLGGFAAELLASSAIVAHLPRHLALAGALATLVVQYAWMALLVVTVSRRWGTGSLRRDLGLGLRGTDVGRALGGWMYGLGAIAVAATALRRLGVPLAGNNPLTDADGSATVTVDRWLAIAVLGMVMLVAAPLFEELLFRSVVANALAGRLPPFVAVGAQALCFALFHVDPSHGWGNIGLVAVLTVLGAALGLVRQRCEGRVVGSMITHSLHNAVAFAVGVAALL